MKRRLIGRVMLILLCILAALPVFAETETGTKPGQDRMHTEVFCVSYLGPRGT